LDSSGKPQRFKLGIDIGGTFTDIVMLDESSGEVYNGKLLSTPQDVSYQVAFKRLLFIDVIANECEAISIR